MERDFPAVSTPQLVDEITTLAGHLKSCAHWLNWKCGIDLGAAREKVRVARSLEKLPRVAASMAEGRLSYAKVRAMTRVADESNEAYLLNIALCGTASHVRIQYEKRFRGNVGMTREACFSSLWPAGIARPPGPRGPSRPT